MSLDFVIWLALLIGLVILTSVVYISIFRKVKRRWRSRLRRFGGMNNLRPREPELRSHYYDRRRETTQYFIGDISCKNNAHSPYLRCAINPSGPCDRCLHYEKKP
jgi:hypothetical protein